MLHWPIWIHYIIKLVNDPHKKYLTYDMSRNPYDPQPSPWPENTVVELLTSSSRCHSIIPVLVSNLSRTINTWQWSMGGNWGLQMSWWVHQLQLITSSLVTVTTKKQRAWSWNKKNRLFHFPINKICMLLQSL